MQLTGEAIGRQGEIFIYNKDREYKKLNKENLSVNTIIKYCATYSIDLDYYEAYKLLAAFIFKTSATIIQTIV